MRRRIYQLAILAKSKKLNGFCLILITNNKKYCIMSKAAFPDGIQQWPIEHWENGHQNFKHRFKKNTSFKILLPESKPTLEEKYKATTANFMWLIKHAIENKNTLRAMGNGWSFSDVAVCDGGAVDTKSLRLSFNLNNSFVAPEYRAQNDAKNLFFVQCGMSVLQVNEKLEASGRSLKHPVLPMVNLLLVLLLPVRMVLLLM